MNYYLLKPEVAGGIGEKSRLKYENGMIKEVLFLEYEMYGWLGDELLTTDPCSIVTESLRDTILKEQLSGIKFRDILLTKSEEFVELYGEKELPDFVELICEYPYEENKNNLQYDFYYDEEKYLVVSEKALNAMKKHKLNHCEIEVL